MTFCIIHIRNGEITNKSVIRKAFEQLKDGAYVVDISKKNKRSKPQNAYYWGVCITLVRKGFEDLGHEINSEEVHEFLKGRFNFKEVINEDTGEVLQVPLSTTRLNKEQFSIYIEKIQRFAVEFLNIQIPNPNEQTEIFT